MRFFFIVSSFPWSAHANNVKAFILPGRKSRLLKEILATSGVEYISFQFLIRNSMWKAKCCQKTLLRRKYESRRRGTRVLLVVGRRHVPSTRNLERGVFVCRNTVDATWTTKQARVQKREYPAGAFQEVSTWLKSSIAYVSRFSFDVAEAMTGSLAISDRMVDDLGRAFRRNLNCILHRAESFELFTTIDSYFILLAKRIASSWYVSVDCYISS